MAVDLVGPFKSWAVTVVNGWRVPYLDACPVAGGNVLLTLDSRYMIEVDVERIESTVESIANCIAVGAGYTCHPGTEGAPEPIRHSAYQRMMALAGPEVV